MHGDANLYLRTVLDQIFIRLDEKSRQLWNTVRVIEYLPADSDWRRFSELLDRCYNGARVIVKHDPFLDRYVNVHVEYAGEHVTLDMASTGMLQVIQILAYACFYKPPLLLLDEPDAHLHADSQSRLYEALRVVASETETRILLASHSPQLIQRLLEDSDAALVWLHDGDLVPVDEKKRPAVPLLMALGALPAGAEVFDSRRMTIVLTEDKDTLPVEILIAANGGARDKIAVLSYNGCGNLSAARMLARMLFEIRNNANIVIHRDRDYRTDKEVKFEMQIAEDYYKRDGIDRVVELFTPLNDVEHSFAQVGHLQHVFKTVAPEKVEEAVQRAISERTNSFFESVIKARQKIDQDLYGSTRMRGKTAWEDVSMPKKAPDLSRFYPKRGSQVFEFENCHGKELMRGIKGLIHNLVGGASEDVLRRIFSPSDALKYQIWLDAFARATPGE